jgi:hypothetical protein
MNEVMIWMSGGLVVVCILWAIKLSFDIRKLDRSIEQSSKRLDRLRRVLEKEYDDE